MADKKFQKMNGDICVRISCQNNELSTLIVSDGMDWVLTIRTNNSQHAQNRTNFEWKKKLFLQKSWGKKTAKQTHRANRAASSQYPPAHYSRAKSDIDSPAVRPRARPLYTRIHDEPGRNVGVIGYPGKTKRHRSAARRNRVAAAAALPPRFIPRISASNPTARSIFPYYGFHSWRQLWNIQSAL